MNWLDEKGEKKIQLGSLLEFSENKIKIIKEFIKYLDKSSSKKEFYRIARIRVNEEWDPWFKDEIKTLLNTV
jgi:hypothetical protein